MKTMNQNDAPTDRGSPPAPCSEEIERNAPCWCGEENPEYADEKDGLDSRCHGWRVLHCYCGGDLCVCHNHGETECFGCPDCEEDNGDDYDDEP